MEVTYTVTVDISEQRIADMLVGAFEGGSNYWMGKIHYSAPLCENDQMIGNEKYPCYVAYPLKPGGSIQITVPEGDELPKLLDMQSIQRGLQLMAKKSPKHFADMLEENDDATTADVFLQYCVFDEIIYG